MERTAAVSGTEAALLIAELMAISAGIALAMLAVFAQVTGWRRLAKDFPALTAVHGAPTLRPDGVLLGAWGWNAPPLRIALDPQALWLLPWPPFNVAFHAVRLPWEAIVATESRRFLLFEVLELRYGQGPKATLGFVKGPAATAIAAGLAARSTHYM